MLKISVNAVLTKSSMRGLTAGKKGLQLTLMILSSMLSASRTRLCEQSGTGPYSKSINPVILMFSSRSLEIIISQQTKSITQEALEKLTVIQTMCFTDLTIHYGVCNRTLLE